MTWFRYSFAILCSMMKALQRKNHIVLMFWRFVFVAIDDKKLLIRVASKSLAIRKYTEPVDFTKLFETQESALRNAFDAAKALQDLIPILKIR